MKAKVNPIEQAIAETVEPHGFKKKGKAWYLQTEDTILFIGLQKSNFGQQYYINLVVLVRKLSDLEHPRDNQCHITNRLESLTDNEPDVKRALDLEDMSITNDRRVDSLKRSIATSALPFLMSFASIPKIRATLLADTYKGLAVRKEVRSLEE